MTFAEAQAAMKKGRKVTHLGFNPGWYVVADGKGFASVHDGLRSRLAYRMDDDDTARNDWLDYK